MYVVQKQKTYAQPPTLKKSPQKKLRREVKKVSLIYEYRVEEKCGILLQLYTLVLVFPAEAVSDFSSSW